MRTLVTRAWKIVAVAMVLVCPRVADAQSSNAFDEFVKANPRPDASLRLRVDKLEDVDKFMRSYSRRRNDTTDEGAHIGIHRPYFETPTKSPTTAEVSAAMARMRENLVAYLSAMNVDRALADDMMKTAPENIRYLTPGDLNRYGLLERDPVAEEATSLKEASKYGLSRSEYMKRRLRIKEVCIGQYVKTYAECAAEIFSGKDGPWLDYSRMR
jgi:hypothetical protein